MKITKSGRFISDIENLVMRRRAEGMFDAKCLNLAGDRIAHRDHGAPNFPDLLQFHFPPREQRRDPVKLHNLGFQTSHLHIELSTDVGINSSHPLIEEFES